MELTQVYVEQVIIGALVLITVAVLATGAVPLPDKDMEATFGFAFLGAAYVAGILYDRIADSLLERLERRKRFKFVLKDSKPALPLVKDPFEEYGKKLSVEHRSLAYLEARMRILRALATLLPAMTLAFLLARDSSGRPLAMIAAPSIYLLFGLLCGAMEFPATNEFEKLKRWPPRSVWLEPAFFGLVAMTLLNVYVARDSCGVLIAIGGAVLALIAAWAWLRVYGTILHAIKGD